MPIPAPSIPILRIAAGARGWRAFAFAIIAAAIAACGSSPSREEQEAARNAFSCQLGGERLIVKFETDEVRLVMPDGDRVVLYRIPDGAGLRYTNGTFDLRGKGVDLQMIRNGTPMALVDCKPVLPPK